MVFSLINSEEEMNQQVLYLLAIGRFYTQGNNNSTAETGQSQTSLAMQSLLSGTVSQQINNVLSNVVNNSNWNFGANISTGDERLEQCRIRGYTKWTPAQQPPSVQRTVLDIATTRMQQRASSVIFDLRYLLFPNGNFAIPDVHQTNDRYFTHNSLNTQGIGLILKKDFNSFRDLFRKKKKKMSINKVK